MPIRDFAVRLLLSASLGLDPESCRSLMHIFRRGLGKTIPLGSRCQLRLPYWQHWLTNRGCLWSLTPSQQSLYLAPEFLNNPAAAIGPGDVYSLAKTMWVLITGQRFPLPGHISAEQAQSRLSSYAVHERLRPIELLIDRATQLDPTRRPSMADLAEELRLWVSPAAGTNGSQH